MWRCSETSHRAAPLVGVGACGVGGVRAPRRAALAALLLLAAAMGLASDSAFALPSPPPSPAIAASPAPPLDSLTPTSAPHPLQVTPIRPRFSLRADGLSLALASAASWGSRTIPHHRLDIPGAGLDPATIHWGVDRRSIHAGNGTALRWSDRSLTAALALPLVLAVARAPVHPDLRGLAGRFVLYTEATLWNDAVTTALKRSVSRPRPFLYRDQGADPARPPDGSFESMPSGHASRAWCAVSFALVDHLYTRPGAGPWEDAGVGFVAGAAAGLAAALRVRSGVHFPSDVLAGAGVGIACGTGVPLWRGYTRDGNRAPAPGGRRWLRTAAGAAAGALAGVGAAELFGGR
jgi:membrane-associated phospholipid phosphatase